jgi:hypothetical protein
MIKEIDLDKIEGITLSACEEEQAHSVMIHFKDGTSVFVRQTHAMKRRRNEALNALDTKGKD